LATHYETYYKKTLNECSKERDKAFDSWHKWDHARFELEQVQEKLKTAKLRIEELEEFAVANERYRAAIRDLQERLYDKDIELLGKEAELSRRAK